jgi:energy-coupling factor transporter ATP-binding protein EcfA2
MSTTFDFTKCLSFIEVTGKKLYHPNFRVIADDYEIIFKLLVYFLADKANCEKYGISLRKGIILSGPVGCGKTSLINILRCFQKPEDRFVMKTCRDVSFEFIQDGYPVISKYSKLSFNKNDQPRVYCFDDLGTENNLKYFGNDCNVMAEILLSRYELFVSRGMLTHLTTNLNSSEIEEAYGTRIRSRLREQFNLIAFSESAKDKRV